MPTAKTTELRRVSVAKSIKVTSAVLLFSFGMTSLLTALPIAGLRARAMAEDSSGTAPLPQAQVGLGQPGKFPIKINKAGSYKLNGNLTVKNSADAIDVNVSNVTIDLNGFTITGGTFGINGAAASAVNTTVINGTITTSSAGVVLGDGGVVRNLRVLNEAGSGTACGAIVCGSHCTIAGNTASDDAVCGGTGAITAGPDALVTSNSANGTTGGSGIVVGAGSVVSGNAANGNSSDGIAVGGLGALVSHNTASNNVVGLSFGASQSGFEDNVLLNNSTADVQGGTSMGGGNTNLCTSGVC